MDFVREKRLKWTDVKPSKVASIDDLSMSTHLIFARDGIGLLMHPVSS